MWNPFAKKPSAKAQKGAVETVTLTIDGMHCASCAMNIDGVLEDMEGVQESKTSYAHGTTTVTYDSQKLSVAAMGKAIHKLGYSVQEE